MRQMEKKTWTNESRIWEQVKNVLQSNHYLVVYDLETTGKSSQSDRFVQIAAVRYKIGDDFTLNYDDQMVFVVNPGMPISKGASEVNGFTDESVADKPSEADIFDEVMDFFRDYPVSGYNIQTFDNHFMERYYARQMVEWAPNGVIDVIKVARAMLRTPTDVKDYKLKTVADFFGIEFKAHDALGDTTATSEVLKILIRECIEKSEAAKTIPETTLIKPTVKAVKYWDGYRGFSRIYVETSAGSVYYDLRNYCWGNKDADIDRLDMGYVEAEAWKMAECSSEDEFKRFKGYVLGEMKP